MECQECVNYLSLEEINNGWQLCTKCRMKLIESLNIEYARRDKLLSNDLNAALKLIEVYRKRFYQFDSTQDNKNDCGCDICKAEVEYEKATSKGQN